MTAETTDINTVNLDIYPGEISQTLPSTYSGRTFTVSACSQDELLQTMKSIFQQNAYSIDFTGVSFGTTFDCFVEGVKQSKSIQKITLTASKLTDVEVEAINILATDKKGLILVDSEGGFIGGVHTNWAKYYKELYFDMVELERTKPRRTPDEGFKIYRRRYKKLPEKTVLIGDGPGSNAIPLILYGVKNIDIIDIDQRQALQCAQNLKNLKLTEVAKKANVKYHLCEFMNFPVDEKDPYEFLVSNYVWSYRTPENFKKCWKKSVESVAEDGFLCGEFFGTPPSSPRAGITFHTLDEAISLLQSSNLEILYFEIEPHQVSLSTRKDAETIPWGDLYRVAARKTSDAIDARSYEMVKEFLVQQESPYKRSVYNILDSEITA